MKIYLASSWRNPHQPEVLKMLRDAGHKVYDFRNPAPDNAGFSWQNAAPKGMNGTPEYKHGDTVTLKALRETLRHPVAERGFAFDLGAMQKANATVLLLPCGNSAHLEFGWSCGAGKISVVYAPPGVEIQPELMYLCGNALCTSPDELLAALSESAEPGEEAVRWIPGSHPVHGY